MRRLSRWLALAAAASGVAAPAAIASSTQEALMQDNTQLLYNLGPTLNTMRSLGVSRVKVTVYWNQIAPARRPRNAGDPAAYPAANWGFLDRVDRAAAAEGLKVGFMVTGPVPSWAKGPGAPPPRVQYSAAWKPNASDYGAFVHALGERYDGGYTPAGQGSPLPRVNWWSIWNEPNYGPDLAPQAIDNNKVYTGASLYRALVDHAFGALSATGHRPGRDVVLLGETAPRGVVARGYPGNGSGTVPITFIQSLYCVDGRDRELTGRAARLGGCPGNASRFRAQHPALFKASGWADHPYAQGTPPDTPTFQCGINRFCFNTRTKRSSPGYTDFAVLGRLESLLRRLQGRRVMLWNTEYGFWTNPPNRAHGALPPATAALYMNWAEYLSYRNPYVASYSQYLLVDPASGQFADGLELYGGKHLATYDAYELPLYMPATSASHAVSLTVWGAVRPAPYALSATGFHQRAYLQFQAGGHGRWTTIRTVTITNPRGYFQVRQPFTRSGNVRIAWTQPGGSLMTSRTQAITIR
jgi:hypothetical protein